MSKRATSLNSGSNARDEINAAARQTRRLFRSAIRLLPFLFYFDLLAQRNASCDSLESARAFYHEANFESARILLGNCEEPPALELRACIAFKENKLSRADTLLCKLLARVKDYKFDPKRLLPPGLSARAEKLKKNFRTDCDDKLFGLRHPRLLIGWDTNILHWLEVNLGAGSNLGSAAKNPILLHARGNLADFAELEFRAIEIANSLADGRTELPTLAVRTQFPLNRIHSQLPVALSAIFRTSLELRDWDVDEIANMKFRKRLKEARLFVSSFKYWRTFEFHIGVSVSSLSTCPYDAGAVLDDSLCSKKSPNVNLFAAYQWRYREAIVMMTWEAVPEYKFDRIKPLTPMTQDVFTFNVRALPAAWLALDLGGIWYSELNNFNLKLGATIGFSLAKIFSKPR